MTGTALLFPGQGSQYPGMLADLPDTAAARKARDAGLAAARKALGTSGPWPSGKALDDADVLADDRIIQVAMVVAGVATAAALTDDYGVEVECVAGHSVGSFGAAVVAGVLSIEQAVRLVVLRAEHMQRACPDGRWGMAAVLGLGGTEVSSLIEQAGTTDDPVWNTDVNSGYVAVAGTVRGLDALGKAVVGTGARDFRRLDVPVASHGPVQAPTEKALRAELHRMHLGTQKIAYFTNVGGRRVDGDTGLVAEDLAAGVTHPIRWVDAVQAMAERGIGAAVEVLPGSVLSDRMRHEDGLMPTYAVSHYGASGVAKRVGPGERD